MPFQVLRIYELTEGLTGGLDLNTQDGYTATRVFQVEFNYFNASTWDAITARNPNDPLPADEVYGIPEYGVAHPDDPTSYVMAKHGEPVDGDASCWKVTVGYGYPKLDASAGGSPSAPSDSQKGEKSGEKPTPLPSTKVTRGTWTRQKAWDKDLNGAVIENSATDPFDPPLTTEQPLSEWTVVRSQLTFSDLWKTDFEGATNNGQYTIGDKVCAVATLKIARITADEVPETDKTPRYYTVTIVIQEDPDGWNPQPLDRGWRQLVAGKLTPMLDPPAVKPGAPPLLDGSGVRKAQAAAAVYRGPFKMHQARDYDWLAITWHT